MFNGKYVVNKKLSVHGELQNPKVFRNDLYDKEILILAPFVMMKGAFIFHKDNGTSIAYVVARNVASTVDGTYVIDMDIKCEPHHAISNQTIFNAISTR